MAVYPAETRADLMRYYGIDADKIGVDYSPTVVASCLACLPLGSSLLARIEPKTQYTKLEYLVHAIVDIMAGEHIPYPWEKHEGEDELELEGFATIDEFLAWESQPWKEDTDSGLVIS